MTIAHWTAFHDAAELGENAGGIDNATAVIGDHRPNNCLMAFEVAHSACFVRAHQRSVEGDVSGEDGSQSAIDFCVSGAAVRMIAILAEPVHTHVTTILMDA